MLDKSASLFSKRNLRKEGVTTDLRTPHNPNQNPSRVNAETDKLVLESVWKCKAARTVWVALVETKVGGLLPPLFTSYSSIKLLQKEEREEVTLPSDLYKGSQIQSSVTLLLIRGYY